MTLGRSLVSSTLWLGIGKATNQIFSIVVFAILSRVLDPIEFGIVAFAVIFIEIMGVVTWAGASDSIVRRENLDDVYFSTAIWVSFFISIVLFLVLVFVFAPAASLLGYPGIEPIIAVLAATLMINSFDSVLSGQLRREFSYRKIAVRGIIANIAGGVISILLAFWGAGVWALVFQRVFAQIIQFAITVSAVGWRVKLMFDRNYAQEILSFSANVMGAQFLNQLNQHVTGLILGIFAGPVPLAIYRTGNRFLSSLHQLIMVPIQQPLLSAFARMEDEKRPGAFLRVIQATALFAFPLYIGTSVVAQEIVAILFGPKWAESAIILAFLGLTIGATLTDFILSPLLTAIGKGNLLLRVSAIVIVANTLATAATVPFGLNAVAAGQVLRAYLCIIITMAFVRSAIGVSFTDLLKATYLPLISAFIMAACLYALRIFVVEDLHVFVRLIVLISAGAAIYAGLILLSGRKMLRDTFLTLLPRMPGFLQKVTAKLSRR